MITCRYPSGSTPPCAPPRSPGWRRSHPWRTSWLRRPLGVEEMGETFFNPSSFERLGIPPLGSGQPRQVTAWRAETPPGLLFEDQPDRGDLYTFEPTGDPVRSAPTGISAERLEEE